MSQSKSSKPQVIALDRADAAPRVGRSLVLAAMIVAILMSSVEATIIATVAPQLVARLGGFDLFSWVFTAYLLAQAVVTPIYGRLADIYGRKPTMLASIGLFLVGSILCGFSWSMISLVGFRVVQGIGAGGLVPLAQTVIGDLYTPVERARLQGYVSCVWAVGSILGPLIGAFLVAHTIWSMVFWINVPFVIVAAAMIVVWLHEDLQYRPHSIDYLGAALMVLGSGLLMFAVLQATHLRLFVLIPLVAVALALLAAFFLHEARASEPMVPIALLLNRIIAAGTIGGCVLGAIFMGSSAFLSLYVQGVMGRSAIVAGLVLMTPSLSWPIGSTSGGWLMLRTSYRATLAIGAVPLLIGCVLMIALGATSGPLFAAAGAAFIGVGMGLTNNTYTVAVQGSVGWVQRGVATSMLLFMQQFGEALGAAIFGGIINAELSHQNASGDMADRIMDPVLRHTLSPGEVELLTEAISRALHNVYLITGALGLVVLVTAVLMPARLNPRRPAGER